MKHDRVVLDTNVIIRHGASELTKRGLLSAVVLQEVTAGARDNAELRLWGSLGQQIRSEGRLLVPDGEDWFEAGRVLSLLRRGATSVRPGPTLVIDRGEQQRLVRDVLIARSAKRINAEVATDNRADFEKIRRFCNVRVVHPARVL